MGGTSLDTAAGTSRDWPETAWHGAGSGCSAVEAKPTWQTVIAGRTRRAEAGVSAVADPATGVAVYQTFGAPGWNVHGGTSAATSLTLHASGGSGSYTWTATGLPNGLSINTTTGVISGTSTVNGAFTAAATSTSSSGSATFLWTIAPAGSSCAATQLLGQPPPPSSITFTGTDDSSLQTSFELHDTSVQVG